MKYLVLVLSLVSGLVNAANCSSVNSMQGRYVMKFTNQKIVGSGGATLSDFVNNVNFIKSAAATASGTFNGGVGFEDNRRFLTVTTGGQWFVTNDTVCRLTVNVNRVYTQYSPLMTISGIRCQLEVEDVTDNGVTRIVERATGICGVGLGASTPYTFGTGYEYASSVEIVRVN